MIWPRTRGDVSAWRPSFFAHKVGDRIVATVAVGTDGVIMAPCGRCREMIRQVDLPHNVSVEPAPAHQNGRAEKQRPGGFPPGPLLSSDRYVDQKVNWVRR